MHPERPEALARGAPESEQTEEAKAAFGALEKTAARALIGWFLAPYRRDREVRHLPPPYAGVPSREIHKRILCEFGYPELAPRAMKIRQNCSSPNARSFVKIGCLADAGAALTLRGSDPGR